MTREEAERIAKAQDIGIGSKFTSEFISDIYDDFESRTCENCRYYNSKYEYCDNSNSVCNHLVVDIDKDFGCNKFERREE